MNKLNKESEHKTQADIDAWNAITKKLQELELSYILQIKDDKRRQQLTNAYLVRVQRKITVQKL